MEYPPEGRTRTDPNTGVRVRQVTDHPSISHHPFYYLPAMDDAMRHLVFVSHRSGRAEIFVEVQEDGTLVQLTEHEGLVEWSVHPSHDGRHVYFTDVERRLAGRGGLASGGAALLVRRRPHRDRRPRGSRHGDDHGKP